MTYSDEAKRFQEEATRVLRHGVETRLHAIEECVRLLRKTYNNISALAPEYRDEGHEFLDLQRHTTDVLRDGATAILRHADVFNKNENIFKLWAESGKKLSALKHREDKIFSDMPKSGAKPGSVLFTNGEFLEGVEDTQHNLIIVLHDNALLRAHTGGLQAVWDAASHMKVIRQDFDDIDRLNLNRIHDDIDADNARIGDLIRHYNKFYL